MDDAAVRCAAAAHDGLRCIVGSANVTAGDCHGTVAAARPYQRFRQAARHLNVHQVQMGCMVGGCPLGKEHTKASHAPSDEPVASADGQQSTCITTCRVRAPLHCLHCLLYIRGPYLEVLFCKTWDK